jgi:hypothetical protein
VRQKKDEGENETKLERIKYQRASRPCCSSIVTHLYYAYLLIAPSESARWGHSAVILPRIWLGLFLISRGSGNICFSMLKR